MGASHAEQSPCTAGGPQALSVPIGVSHINGIGRGAPREREPIGQHLLGLRQRRSPLHTQGRAIPAKPKPARPASLRVKAPAAVLSARGALVRHHVVTKPVRVADALFGRGGPEPHAWPPLLPPLPRLPLPTLPLLGFVLLTSQVHRHADGVGAGGDEGPPGGRHQGCVAALGVMMPKAAGVHGCSLLVERASCSTAHTASQTTATLHHHLLPQATRC